MREVNEDIEYAVTTIREYLYALVEELPEDEDYGLAVLKTKEGEEGFSEIFTMVRDEDENWGGVLASW